MNFDFSGMFGGGFTNNLNKNNFDFSAYAPKKKEPVVDPIDVVSNKTPEAKVEILEGAGTVAITKPDPIAQAIESLRGKDLTQSFDVNPTTDMTTTPVTENIDNNIRNTVQNLTAEQPVETFEPIQESVGSSNILQAVEQVNQATQPPIDYSSMTWEDLEEQRLAGGGFSLGGDFVAKDQAAREADLTDQGLMFQAGLGEDLRQDYNPNDQFTTGAMGEVLRSGNQADFKNLIDQGTVNRLAEIGLKADYKQDKYKGYRYNPETGQYDYYDNTPSMIEEAVPALIKTGIIATATAGIGNALASSSAVAGVAGGNAAVANAIGNGLASGLTTAATGGNTEDILMSAALGGLGGYTEGVSEAQELAQANVDNLSAIANSGVAGESLIAQSQLANATAALNEINATAEVVNTINNTVDLVQAVDQKDALGIVNSALALGGMSSSQTLASDKIKETFEEGSFIVDNADVIASVGVEAVATIAEGGDAKDVLQDSANTLVKEVVLTDMNVKTAVQDTIGGNEFVDNNIDAITQAVKAGGFALTDGKNREETIRDAFDAYRKNDGQLTPELEDSESPDFFKNIEKWYHENIEDPLENWWQEIEPVREMFEEAGQVVVDTVDEYVVQPVTRVVESIIEGADEAVRALPTTKEDWEQLEDTIKEGASDAAEVVRDTGRAIEQGYDTAEDFVKEEVAPAINATGRAIREAIPDVNLDLPDVDVDLPSADVSMPDVDLPSVDIDIPLSVSADPEITQERRGFYYDDSSLVSNPFLRGGEQQRIRSLTDMIAMEKEAANRQAKILADEEERKLRYKSVFGVNPNVQVKYNG